MGVDKSKFEITKNFSVIDAQDYIEKFKYQENLTKKLDAHDGDFNQEILNEIVLWKVNRYAELLDFKTLNQVSKNERILDEALTKDILRGLLPASVSGIRLAMASTILRFKNPHIYQIIDQRVYRVLYGQELKLPAYLSVKNIEAQIDMYIEYLKKLRAECDRLNIDYFYADRIFYQLDRDLNGKENLNNYGSK